MLNQLVNEPVLFITMLILQLAIIVSMCVVFAFIINKMLNKFIK